MKSKYFVLVVAIICLGLMFTGGTYAFLSWSATVKSNTYTGTTTCFLVTYDYKNADNTLPITGTMFQSKTPKGGLSGKVTMALSSSCNITSGTATLKLYFNSATSNVFFNGDKALKYAVYDSATATTPISSGVLSAKSTTTIGSGSNFALTKTARSFYVYIWLDGALADNEYVDLPFSGYIIASATQSE